MHLSLRPFLIAAALAAVGGFAAAALGGCASKHPLPEAPAAAATPASKQPSKQTGTGASAGAEPSGTGASTGAGIPSGGCASAGAAAPGIAGPSEASGGGSTGARTAASGGASVGVGMPSGRGASAGAGAAAGAGPSAVSGGASISAGTSVGSGAGAATPSGRAQTSDERRAALDKRLNESLGSFDEQLRKEQQRIAQERDARQATVMTVAAVDGSPKPGADQNAEASGNTATEPSVSRRGESRSARARGGDLKSDKSSAGGGSASGNGAVSREIPNGNDDDVIARRLRKAAEQETDPELKDKLWKEYVEYKKNTQGK
jgi:hypothetical protein